MSEVQRLSAVGRLWEARLRREAVGRLTDDWPEMTEEDAYAIGGAIVEKQKRACDSVAGFKLGFTSQAMREALGVRTPNYGFLTRSMLLASPAQIVHGVIHPRVEPEIALRTRHELGGNVNLATVARAIGEIAPALEIVDSRYIDFNFTFLDNTADNSSASLAVIGAWRSAEGVNLTAITVQLTDGQERLAGSSAAVMGNPVVAVAWLAEALHRHGRVLPAGPVILTGGMTAPLKLVPGGQVEADFGWLGRVSASRPEV